MVLPETLSSNWKKLQKRTKLTNNKVLKKSNSVTKKEIKRDEAKLLKEKINSHLERKNKNKISTVLANNDETQAGNAVSSLTSEIELSESKKSIGKYLAIDCEFVGVGLEGGEDALARVSIVNFHGFPIYDKFVKPREKVVDWRTWVSGIRPHDMKNAISFVQCQKEVSELMNNRVLVGHAIDHDLDALLLSHPKYLIRDTSKHQNFKKLSKGKTPSLKKLAKHFLDLDIQGGEHSSVEDAKATMRLYKLEKKEFEKLHQRFNRS
ncbi:hypothetical protein WICMUC_001270 [Wickerhamomyces mucosus]|uniref:RNA exonuclease 4 n=1 Tax=Wickerhamomyces mucosus TaxID=1378264 RepID=A0A9P8PXD0_9ASCO|nr:hypothetical protein WICMUC_001270 [Wickerhamomyces mucosus]